MVAPLSAQHMHDHGEHAAIQALVAVLSPCSGSSVEGTVTFTDLGDGRIQVEADVRGLEPNSSHAIHVHEFGDIRSPDGKSAGGHYNPEKHDHALPKKAERHAGDLGNLEADAAGHAHYVLTVDNITLMGSMNPIIGRGVIVHAGEDDGGQPTGNAGGRIAAGVIGVLNPAL